MSDRVVLLFTKPSVPGRVKTRLIGDLSAVQTAELHAAFVVDLLDRLRDGEFELRLAWALEAGETMPQSDLVAVEQRGDNLGQRLFAALYEAAKHGTLVAAIGSDHPELQSADLEQAFEALESGGYDVVLGPASDGGYYLVALGEGAVREELFENIPWSTSRVLRETLNRCAELDLRVLELHSAFDVDTPADLERLTMDLLAGRVESPETANLLRGWGRLRGPDPERLKGQRSE